MRALVSCYFGTGAGEQWPRLARVLTYSARQHCPTWTHRIEQMAEELPTLPVKASYWANTRKLGWWADVVQAAADGDEILLLDTDTVLLRSLDAVWDEPFDVAYTIRPPGYPYPLNGGVLFVRVSDRTRAFLQLWRDENARMLVDPVYQRPWRKRYAGLNQAALGALLERKTLRDLVVLARLPCAEWNCEDSAWAAFSDTTRILHIKSALRRAVFSLAPAPSLSPLVHRWRNLEREAGRAEVAVG